MNNAIGAFHFYTPFPHFLIPYGAETFMIELHEPANLVFIRDPLQVSLNLLSRCIEFTPFRIGFM
jgi:hypothetical protein